MLRALEIDDKFAKAYYKLGLLQVKHKEYSSSLENFEKAINCNPKYAEAHYQIALLLMDETAQKEITANRRKELNPKTPCYFCFVNVI